MDTEKIASTIYIDEDVRQALEELAQEDERSFSQYCNRVLRDHVKKKLKN